MRGKKLGFIALIAIVVGSQIGSGMFVLPSDLAQYGVSGLLGWAVSITGAICLALVFSDLSAHLPRSGGPHVYVSEAFGKVAGFYMAWVYWDVSWLSNSVLLVTVIKYLTVITGDLSTIAVLSVEMAVIAIVVIANVMGLRFSGFIETFLICLKTVPLIILPIAFLTVFDPTHFKLKPPELTSYSNLISTLSSTALLTFWCFIGVECGTTTAGSIRNPAKTLPRAITIGTIVVSVIYMLNIISVVGVMGFDSLMNTPAPYSLVMSKVFGHSSDVVISTLIIVVCIGTLNSWTLTSSQTAYGAYVEGLFPKIFGKVNKFDAPIVALLISAIGIIPFLLYEQLEQGGLDKLINLIVSIFLYVYLGCCAAYFKLVKRWYARNVDVLKKRTLACISGAVCTFVLLQDIMISFVVLAIFVVLGWPVYLRCKRQRKEEA
ncbi:MAG: amino acid permease [Holosporales bacterium]|jgi:APA family basic amino acid/polyamine antiporter|nr:amino acid permease [Holosporales bacterium]